MIELRADQRDLVRSLALAFAGASRRVLVQAATGAGKGTIAAHVMARRAAADRSSLFICHREEINLDIRSRLVAAGAPSVRLLMGDHVEGSTTAAVTVASIQTLDARPEIPTLDPSLVVWDECHRTKSASYARVAARFADALHLGLSATPARADGQPLDFFERLIPGAQIQVLVAAGLLAPIRVFAPDEQTDDLSADPLDVVEAGTPTVLFASSVLESIRLCAVARTRGLRAVHVDGRTKDEPRREAIAAFNRGEIDLLCNYRLLTEGVDLPGCAAIVLATKVDSIVAYLQSIGRARRPQLGKVATLHDLHGSLWTHGHPDQDRTFSLEGRAISAIDPLAPVAQCPTCLAWGPPGRCPCGAERAVKPPKPVRVTKRELREQRLAAQPQRGALWDAWVSIVQQTIARGRKPQGAALEYHRRFGSFPRWTFAMAAQAAKGAA